ncbi:hypothetical protein COY07_04635 [Candidatus Peregrinibacteria bacterium CG_4_10_14_0_2_um_filter_43_11]|nr:MAG: hypothetical protein COY07_04635 [Candidatus Peregrinibacteria bacterium CG_4_10_14_0_2_um_filter_43_11]
MSRHKDFVAYYNEYKNKILTYMMYRVSFDRPLAEDLTSEVFLKVYDHFEDYDADKPFEPWLFTIARNHLFTYFRRHKTTAPLEEAYEMTDEPTFADELDTKLAMEKVTEKLSTLPEEQQEVLLLRFHQGLSHSEIGEIVGKNEGAVRTVLSRALASLRKKLNVN